MDILIIIFILCALFLFFRRFSGQFDKGEWGERQTAYEIEDSLDPDIYKAFHDIIIPSFNGTAQIDHLIISRFGIFIIETKCLDGWIFGQEKQKKWTQVLFRKKFSFQNPLYQVYRQKKVLSNFLDLQPWKINTSVHFVGNCEFKTCIPDNVILYGLGSYISMFQNEVFTEKEVSGLINKVANHVESSTLSLVDHIESLQTRHSSTVKCPRCGGYLQVKTANKGKAVGSRFLGCSSFPRCRFTRDL